MRRGTIVLVINQREYNNDMLSVAIKIWLARTETCEKPQQEVRITNNGLEKRNEIGGKLNQVAWMEPESLIWNSEMHKSSET